MRWKWTALNRVLPPGLAGPSRLFGSQARLSDLMIPLGKRSGPVATAIWSSSTTTTPRHSLIAWVDQTFNAARKCLLNGETFILPSGEKKSEEESNNSEEPKVIKKEKLKEVVFVLTKDNHAKLREVTTGISDFDNIEILSGLTEGEQIISGPYVTVSKKLKDGELVKKKEANKDNKEKK